MAAVASGSEPGARPTPLDAAVVDHVDHVGQKTHLTPLRQHVRHAATHAGDSDLMAKSSGSVRPSLAAGIGRESPRRSLSLDVTQTDFDVEELISPCLDKLDGGVAESLTDAVEGRETPNRKSGSMRRSLISDCHARHEEGIRRLRRSDYTGAVQLLEAAWDLAEAEFPTRPSFARHRSLEMPIGRHGSLETSTSPFPRRASSGGLSRRESKPLSRAGSTLVSAIESGRQTAEPRDTQTDSKGSDSGASDQDNAEDEPPPPKYVRRKAFEVHSTQAIKSTKSLRSEADPEDSKALQVKMAEDDIQRAFIEAAIKKVAALPSTDTQDANPHDPNSGKAASARNSKREYESKLPILIDLTSAHSRLQNWERVDTFADVALELIGDERRAQFERQHSDPHLEADEKRWILLMVRRGVACVLMGPEHFQRAQSYFDEVLKVVPKNRDAKRGIQSLNFLKAQMPVGGAVYEATREAMAAMA